MMDKTGLKVCVMLIAAMFLATPSMALPQSTNVSGDPANLLTTILSNALAPLGTYGTSSTTNWSGYAVTGTANSVTDVKGSWKVPSIQGACSSTNTYSLAWIGIDGYTSSTVEQIGTESNCQGGVATYTAFYETYPKPSVTISSLAIKAGDVISAEVSFASGSFTLTITDKTTSHTFSTTASVSKAQRNSAEWIMEAPSSTGGTLPLANFGTANYGTDYTSMANTGYATVSGATHPIGSFGSSVVQIFMKTGSGVTKASPSSLSSDGTSFNVQWVSQGP